MKTEKEKMLLGEPYNAFDQELILDRKQARVLLHKLNITEYGDQHAYQKIIKELLPNCRKDLWIEPPFRCDYGYNIHAGEGVYFNFNCVLLDVMPITIGDNVLIGPGVQIYTATHPVDPKERLKGVEFAKPITIGSGCWIGGGAIILPGVTIGERVVVGAGSVVTKDIPSDQTVAGNPARRIN